MASRHLQAMFDSLPHCEPSPTDPKGPFTIVNHQLSPGLLDPITLSCGVLTVLPRRAWSPPFIPLFNRL